MWYLQDLPVSPQAPVQMLYVSKSSPLILAFMVFFYFNIKFKNSLFFTPLDVKGAEEQLYMGVQLFKAFSFPFRLAVADTEQDDDRRNIHPRQRIRVFVSQFAVCNQRTEDACMVGDHPIYIAFGKQFGKLGERNCSNVIIRRNWLMVLSCSE